MRYYKFVYILLVSIFGFLGCSEPINTNVKDSVYFNSKEKRIEILKKEIIAETDFINAEFELFNVNGFTNTRLTVPGSSSLDYKFVLKISPIQLIDKWTEGLDLFDSENYDIGWTHDIIKNRRKEWMTTSQPEFFKRTNENVTLVVYREEGIIFKRVIIN